MSLSSSEIQKLNQIKDFNKRKAAFVEAVSKDLNSISNSGDNKTNEWFIISISLILVISALSIIINIIEIPNSTFAEEMKTKKVELLTFSIALEKSPGMKPDYIIPKLKSENLQSPEKKTSESCQMIFTGLIFMLIGAIFCSFIPIPKIASMSIPIVAFATIGLIITISYHHMMV